MSAKKKVKTGIYRTIVQIAGFLLLPVLYASTLADIKYLYLGALHQDLAFSAALPAGIRVVGILLLTAMFGRFFCGWLCSFGAVGDWIYAIAKKIHPIKFKMPERVDKILKKVKYVYLAALIVILWNADIPALGEASPWGAFASIFNTNGPDLGAAFEYYTLGTVFLVGLLIGSIFVERFFCRYLCPLGAVFAIMSRLKFLRINKNKEHCGACRLCTKNCAMGIPLYQMDKVNSGECIMCMRCTSVCPRKNTALCIGDTNVNKAVAGTVAVVAIASVALGSDALAEQVSISTDNAGDYEASVQGTYTDGTYEGSGTGFHGGTTTVSVVVENGNIADVEVLSYEDDKEFFIRAEESIISQIIETQSTEVDAVSGATYSCAGIMSAVADALGVTSETANEITTQREGDKPSFDGERKGHKGSEFDTEDSETDTESEVETESGLEIETEEDDSVAQQQATTQSTETQTQTTDTSASTTSAAYVDGIYEGSGIGFRNGTTTVSVTIENGVISNVEVVSYEDDWQFFEMAYESVISNIVAQQDTSVDAVSGATYSSQGIMEAVADALSSATNN